MNSRCWSTVNSSPSDASVCISSPQNNLEIQMDNPPRNNIPPPDPPLNSLEAICLEIEGEEDLTVQPAPPALLRRPPPPPDDGPITPEKLAGIYLEIEGEGDLTEGPVPEAIRKRWREKGNGPPI